MNQIEAFPPTGVNSANSGRALTNRCSCPPERRLEQSAHLRRTVDTWLRAGRQLNSMLSVRQFAIEGSLNRAIHGSWE